MVRLCVSLLALVFTLFCSGVRAADLALVLSDQGGAYTEFTTVFQQGLESGNWRIRWVGKADALESTLPRVDLVVAVGSEATRSSLRLYPRTPIIASLLPRQSFERALSEAGNRPRNSVSAVFLDQPASRLLNFTRQVLPDRRKVAVLVSNETRAALPALKQAAANQGFTLEAEEVENESSLLAALNHLLPRNDLLLALPDSSIYKRDNARTILLTSYRYQRPVIAYSQAFATAGALAAIFSSPPQIAQQTADFVKALPAEPSSLPPPQLPVHFGVSVNRNVGQALGLSPPDEAVLMRSLQEREGR